MKPLLVDGKIHIFLGESAAISDSAIRARDPGSSCAKLEKALQSSSSTWAPGSQQMNIPSMMRTYMRIYVHTLIHTWIHGYMDIYIYIHTYVYINKCLCINIYIYIYTYTYGKCIYIPVQSMQTVKFTWADNAIQPYKSNICKKDTKAKRVATL